jgi:hypothetical protein
MLDLDERGRFALATGSWQRVATVGSGERESSMRSWDATGFALTAALAAETITPDSAFRVGNDIEVRVP